MDPIKLQKQLFDYIASLRRDGILDDQFTQIQSLQDESTPDFVFEVVNIFFHDSDKLISELANQLRSHKIDFQKIDYYVHQFKGSSASIGAAKIKNICMEFKFYCETQNLQGCLLCLHMIKLEYSSLRNTLHTLFEMEKQLTAAMISSRPPSNN